MQGGALPTWLVSKLTGISVDQLRRWHRNGVLVAHARPGRRGVSHAYDWSDYQKARLAAKLLAKSLKPWKLKEVLDDFCDVIEPRSKVAITVASDRAIVKPRAGHAHTAERNPQAAHFDLIEEAALDRPLIKQRLKGIVSDDAIDAIWRELDAEYPLASFSAYSDAVSMDPRVLGGAPTLKGRRIETALVAFLHAGGMAVEQIAEEYEIKRAQVHRALEFEYALERRGIAHAPIG